MIEKKALKDAQIHIVLPRQANWKVIYWESNASLFNNVFLQTILISICIVNFEHIWTHIVNDEHILTQRKLCYYLKKCHLYVMKTFLWCPVLDLIYKIWCSLYFLIDVLCMKKKNHLDNDCGQMSPSLPLCNYQPRRGTF